VPTVDWPRPEDHRPDVFTEVELAGVLAKVTDQFARDLAVFLAYTGLRRAELARLLVADVDAAAGVLWVRGKVRAQSHPLPPAAAAAAARLALLAGGEALISGTTERARRERIAETFRTWQRKLKEPRFHPHALRHSVATIMLRQGAAPGTVQRFLRHASYAMTQRYVHMVEADVRGATARLRLVGGDDDAAQHG
jgi:integrase